MSKTNHYQSVLKSFPEYISLNQMYRICHQSKRTCRYLLESALVPNTDNGKKTHRFTIKTSDVVNYLRDREINPLKYKPPKNYYHTDSGAMLSQSNGKHQGDDDTAAIRKKYEKYFSHWPDVLSIPQVSQMTGYSITSVRKWCSKKRMKSFMINQCYMIPKEYLLDYLSKKHYLRFVIKTQGHSSHTSLSENTENISEKQ